MGNLVEKTRQFFEVEERVFEQLVSEFSSDGIKVSLLLDRDSYVFYSFEGDSAVRLVRTEGCFPLRCGWQVRRGLTRLGWSVLV